MVKNIEKIYDKIREDILADRYRQGEPLPEQKLSLKYGISRSRVRQILQKLETDTLVEKIPGKGAFVRTITAKDLKKIFEMREALEGMATRLAAKRREAEKLDEIRSSFDHPGPDDLRRKIQAGKNLHLYILSSCRNELIINAMEPIMIQMMKVLRDSAYIPNRVNEAYLEHRQILKAIVEQDEDLAEKFMKDHLTNAFKEYLNAMFYQYLDA